MIEEISDDSADYGRCTKRGVKRKVAILLLQWLSKLQDSYSGVDELPDESPVFSLIRAPTEYPTASEPRMVSTVSMSAYVRPKYEIIMGRRNGLTALLPRKMANIELPAPFSLSSLSMGYQA